MAGFLGKPPWGWGNDLLYRRANSASQSPMLLNHGRALSHAMTSQYLAVAWLS